MDAITVGTVAALTGVSVRTLHHYDYIGLVRPSVCTSSGYRGYTDADIERLAARVAAAAIRPAARHHQGCGGTDERAPQRYPADDKGADRDFRHHRIRRGVCRRSQRTLGRDGRLEAVAATVFAVEQAGLDGDQSRG